MLMKSTPRKLVLFIHQGEYLLGQEQSPGPAMPLVAPKTHFHTHATTHLVVAFAAVATHSSLRAARLHTPIMHMV